MNFKEAIDYRKTCLVHDLPLLPNQITILGDIITHEQLKVTDDQLILLAHHAQDIYGQPSLKALSFLDDNTYMKTDICPKYAQKGLVVYMMCEKCKKGFEYVTSGPTISSLYGMCYYYSFSLAIDSVLKRTGNSVEWSEVGDYVVELVTEYFKCQGDHKHYVVFSDFKTKQTTCSINSTNVNSFQNVLDSMMTIDISHMELYKIKDKDQLINKIKLYAMFS